MGQKKITDLIEMNTAPASDDFLVVRDISAGSSGIDKKISYSNLISAGASTINSELKVRSASELLLSSYALNTTTWTPEVIAATNFMPRLIEMSMGGRLIDAQDETDLYTVFFGAGVSRMNVRIPRVDFNSTEQTIFYDALKFYNDELGNLRSFNIIVQPSASTGDPGDWDFQSTPINVDESGAAPWIRLHGQWESASNGLLLWISEYSLATALAGSLVSYAYLVDSADASPVNTYGNMQVILHA